MKVLCTAAIGLVLAVSPAFAHHPFNSEFDANAPVHLTGKVTQVNWNNPHVLIFMTATGAKSDEIWTLEAASPSELSQKGWTQNTLKTGDQIKVDGYRAKANLMTAAARMIELPDGKKLSTTDDADAGPKSPPAP